MTDRTTHARSNCMRWHPGFVLGLVFVLGPGLNPARAQTGRSPYVAVGLGAGDVATRISVQTSPPTGNAYVEHDRNLLAVLHLGIPFGPHFAADAGVRSTFGVGQPIRVLTLGPAIRWGGRVQLHLRGGVGGVEGFMGVACADPSSSCQQYATEWLSGFDLGVGVDLRWGRSWKIGPAAWWAQSTGGTTRYRSMGLGVQLRYR